MLRRRASSQHACSPDERILTSALALAAARAQSYPADRVVLATSDRNLALRACAAGLEAMPLARARAVAEARDAAWRAAYCNHAGQQALEAAAWASRAAAGQDQEGEKENTASREK